jgi:putative PIN family toxin of toxin-antitoxin system
LLEVRAGAFELVVSPMLFAELGEVLARPKFRPYVTGAEAAAYIELIGHEATIHDDPPPGEDPLSADPDDEYLLDLARAAAADVLVSGDSHLLILRDVVPVMSPAEFLASLANR